MEKLREEEREFGMFIIGAEDGELPEVGYMIIEECLVQACIGRVLGECGNCCGKN